jgi:hypothetical protein
MGGRIWDEANASVQSTVTADVVKNLATICGAIQFVYGKSPPWKARNLSGKRSRYREDR